MRPARGPVRRRLQLLVLLVATWRPTWPRVRAAARSVLTSTLALGGSLWAVPGPQVQTAGSVVLLAIAVLLLGVLLRPLLTSLTVLTGSVGMLVAGVLSQALLLGLALSVVPGLEPFSVPEIVVVSWVAAAVAAVVNWLFDAGSEDAFLGQVLGRAVRQAHLHPDATGPGLLVVQLDGVSEPILRQALTAGAMPTLSRWLRSDTHTLRRWHTGLPATTPAGQAVLLHGDVHAVPSFRWYDKAQGRMLVASHPADLAEVERGLSDGRGLLADGGASVSNLFSGDAPVTVLTMSDARLPSSDRGAASFANARFGFVRSIVLFVGQVVTEWHQGRRQRLRDVRPRVHRGGAFVLLRGLTTVVLRDLNVSIVAEQMARGTPVVFCDFVDYDEVAHHAGPSRPEAMRQLDGLDRVLQFFERVGAEVTRSYEIAIVSDHGQSQGTTFLQRTGRTLDDVVRSLLPGVGPAPAEPSRRPAHASESYGPANVLLTGAARSDRIVGAAARTAMRRRDGDRDELTVDRPPAPSPPERVVVAASGSLAHVYVADEPGRVPLERIEARCPGLVAGLARHDGVGVVVGRTADGVLRVVGPDGWRDLGDGVTSGGAGVDPLAVYGDHAAPDLLQLDRRDGVGDLVVLGAYDPRLDEVTAFEELVGSHGGLGGSQTDALLVHPSGWAPPPVHLDGRAVHDALAGRLVDLGLRGGGPVRPLEVTWWGHATCTVDLGGVRVLTDPLLVDRLATLRRMAPSVPADARRADLVLVSHLHPDHLHTPSLRLVAPGADLVVPRGSARYLRALGVPPARVHEVVPGDRVRIGPADVEVLPAAHDERRHALSRVSAPPLGFRVEAGGRSLWYPGDTGLLPAMRDVRPVDLALVPVGGWGPTLPPTHLGPAEAAVAVTRVGARHAVPVHYGTFWPAGMSRLGRHRRLFVEPGERFADQLDRRDDRVRVWVPAHGEGLALDPDGRA